MGARISGVVFLAVITLAWEVTARANLVSALYLPLFTQVLVRFTQLNADLTLPVELGRTLGRMLAGFALAVVSMVPLGFLMGRVVVMHNLLDPTVQLLRPLSAPAIIPAVMLFLGIGNAMKIFVVFYACAFPVLLNTIDGVRSVDPLLVYSARSYGARARAILLKVILPAAWPQIFAGFRVSLPIALIVAITSELIGGNDGLGFFILNNMRTFRIPESYAGLLMVGTVGWALNWISIYSDERFVGRGRMRTM